MKIVKAAVLSILILIPAKADAVPECFGRTSYYGHHREKCWFKYSRHRSIYAKAEHSPVVQLARTVDSDSTDRGSSPRGVTTPKRPPSSMAEQRPLKAKVSGSSPEAAATELGIRLHLEDWQGVMPANEYVKEMWPTQE